MLLTEMTAIVTGGAQGIGAAIAIGLAEHGCSVAILDLNIAQAESTKASLPKGRHLSVQCDITDHLSRTSALQTVATEFGHVDILVNNAGIQYHSALEEMDEERWKRVFDVNIHAMMAMTRDVGSEMILRGSGSIINIGSIASLMGMPRRSAYVTTKTAVLGFTRSSAVEWAQHGIRVNSIGPGYHLTPLFQEYEDAGKIDRDRILRRIPMGRLGTVEDVASVAVFLGSDLSRYVTGQHIMFDGGYTSFGAPEDTVGRG